MSPKSDRYVYKERITQTSGKVKCYRIFYDSTINDSLDNTVMPVDSPQSAEEAYKNILQLFKSGYTSIKMSDDDFYCLFDNLFDYYDVYCTYSYNPDGKNANGSEIKLSIKEKKVEEKSDQIMKLRPLRKCCMMAIRTKRIITSISIPIPI